MRHKRRVTVPSLALHLPAHSHAHCLPSPVQKQQIVHMGCSLWHYNLFCVVLNRSIMGYALTSFGRWSNPSDASAGRLFRSLKTSYRLLWTSLCRVTCPGITHYKTLSHLIIVITVSCLRILCAFYTSAVSSSKFSGGSTVALFGKPEVTLYYNAKPVSSP